MCDSINQCWLVTLRKSNNDKGNVSRWQYLKRTPPVLYWGGFYYDSYKVSLTYFDPTTTTLFRRSLPIHRSLTPLIHVILTVLTQNFAKFLSALPFKTAVAEVVQIGVTGYPARVARCLRPCTIIVVLVCSCTETFVQHADAIHQFSRKNHAKTRQK